MISSKNMPPPIIATLSDRSESAMNSNRSIDVCSSAYFRPAVKRASWEPAHAAAELLAPHLVAVVIVPYPHLQGTQHSMEGEARLANITVCKELRNGFSAEGEPWRQVFSQTAVTSVPMGYPPRLPLLCQDEVCSCHEAPLCGRSPQ